MSIFGIAFGRPPPAFFRILEVLQGSFLSPFADFFADAGNLNKCNLGRTRLRFLQCDFEGVLMPLGPPFSIKLPEHLNLLNCNMYNAKNYFLPCHASHLGIENEPIN